MIPGDSRGVPPACLLDQLVQAAELEPVVEAFASSRDDLNRMAKGAFLLSKVRSELGAEELPKWIEWVQRDSGLRLLYEPRWEAGSSQSVDKQLEESDEKTSETKDGTLKSDPSEFGEAAAAVDPTVSAAPFASSVAVVAEPASPLFDKEASAHCFVLTDAHWLLDLFMDLLEPHKSPGSLLAHSNQQIPHNRQQVWSEELRDKLVVALQREKTVARKGSMETGEEVTLDKKKICDMFGTMLDQMNRKAVIHLFLLKIILSHRIERMTHASSGGGGSRQFQKFREKQELFRTYLRVLCAALVMIPADSNSGDPNGPGPPCERATKFVVPLKWASTDSHILNTVQAVGREKAKHQSIVRFATGGRISSKLFQDIQCEVIRAWMHQSPECSPRALVDSKGLLLSRTFKVPDGTEGEQGVEEDVVVHVQLVKMHSKRPNAESEAVSKWQRWQPQDAGPSGRAVEEAEEFNDLPGKPARLLVRVLFGLDTALKKLHGTENRGGNVERFAERIESHHFFPHVVDITTQTLKTAHPDLETELRCPVCERFCINLAEFEKPDGSIDSRKFIRDAVCYTHSEKNFEPKPIEATRLPCLTAQNRESPLKVEVKFTKDVLFELPKMLKQVRRVVWETYTDGSFPSWFVCCPPPKTTFRERVKMFFFRDWTVIFLCELCQKPAQRVVRREREDQSPDSKGDRQHPELRVVYSEGEILKRVVRIDTFATIFLKKFFLYVTLAALKQMEELGVFPLYTILKELNLEFIDPSWTPSQLQNQFAQYIQQSAEN